MKTILVPVFDTAVTKNILRTKVFSDLKVIPELRIVIIAPSGKEEAYRKEFGGERVFVEDGDLWGHGMWGSFFTGLFLHSIPTNFMRIRQIDWFWNTKKYGHYVGASILRFLGIFSFWRSFLMALGNLEPISDNIRRCYERWSPDVVFAPTMVAPLEVALMRLSRKQGKGVIGMAKSWDNLTSKAFLRVFPDKLIVPNMIGVEEAVSIYGFPRERVIPTGIPQYDDYVKADFLESKETFFKDLGLDPKKRTILYAPAGDWMNEYDKDILGEILGWIREGKIPNTQVLLRLHPAYESKTEELAGDPNLVVERPGTRSKEEKNIKAYEFYDKDVRHLASSIAYTDITINTASTMSIEAAIYDKPVILVGYDGAAHPGYKQSVIRYYDREHYIPIIRSSGAWLVQSSDEMLSAITTYLKTPELHREGRKRILDEECYRMDGKAAERIAQVLLNALRV